MKSLNNVKGFRIATAKARRLQSEVFRPLYNKVVEVSADDISRIHENIVSYTYY